MKSRTCLGSVLVLLLVVVATSIRAQWVEPVAYNPEDLQRTWAEWRDRQITSERAGDAPRLRVMGGVNNDSTVSEGQAYGILFASIFDEQALLDGLWLFAADHLNDQGLMHWHIGDYGQVLGSGAATDAEADMALGLMNACMKARNGLWPASPNDLDYCVLASAMIEAMWTYEVDHPGPGPMAGLDDNPGYELLPGDQWNLRSEYPDGITNLSYFSPGYFRAFADFTGNPGWLDVVARGYEIADAARSLTGNCSGLVSNWSQYDGDPQQVPWQGATSLYFGWDGARFAWRVAVDGAWYGSESAAQIMNAIGGFFASVGIDEVRAEYRMDGTAVNSYRTSFFTAHAASAIWAAPDPVATYCGDASGALQSSPQDAYDTLLNIRQNDYYNDAWRLFAMLLMTGNFPNPMESVEGVVPVTPAPRPTPTPVPTADSSQADFEVWIQQDGPADSQQSALRFRIVNRGQDAYRGVSARFYFTPDGLLPADAYVLESYWDSTGQATVRGPFEAEESRHYFVVDFGEASLGPGATFEMVGTFRLRDWSASLNSENDWWRSGGFSDEATQTTTLPVYVGEVLAAGDQP